MSLMDSAQMQGLSGEDQAKKAIRHVLEQIQDNENIAHQMGLGSQSFALLTEAAATLFNRPLQDVRENFSKASK